MCINSVFLLEESSSNYRAALPVLYYRLFASKLYHIYKIYANTSIIAYTYFIRNSELMRKCCANRAWFERWLALADVRKLQYLQFHSLVTMANIKVIQRI